MITPITLSPQEAAIVAWVEAVVGVEAVVVVANQSAPQPSGAFVTIRVASRRRLSTPDARLSSRASGGGFEAEVFEEWEGTAEINAYGAKSGELAAALHESADDFDVASANAAAGLYLREATPIIDVAAFVDATFEARSRFEVIFGFVKKKTSTALAVEAVTLSGEVE